MLERVGTIPTLVGRLDVFEDEDRFIVDNIAFIRIEPCNEYYVIKENYIDIRYENKGILTTLFWWILNNKSYDFIVDGNNISVIEDRIWAALNRNNSMIVLENNMWVFEGYRPRKVDLNNKWTIKFGVPIETSESRAGLGLLQQYVQFCDGEP